MSTEGAAAALNHAVVTGKLLGDPRPGWGPSDDPVTFLEVEFPVAHPEHPRFLWAYATYDVEVPGDVGGRELEEMRTDASVISPGFPWFGGGPTR